MQHIAIKPETIIKRRMRDALEKFRERYGREMGNEEFTDEHLMSKYRVYISGPTRFSCGQAKYEGPEGTWLCWMNKAGDAISGIPHKKNHDVASFGLYEELEVVSDRAETDLHALLCSGSKELVFQAQSGLTILIRRSTSCEVHYEITWRNRDEKRLHTAFYTGFDAFEQIRENESLIVSNFRIAASYDYGEKREDGKN